MAANNADLSTLKIDRSNKNNTKKNSKLVWIGIIAAAVILFFLFVNWNSLFSSAVEVKLTTATLQSPSQANAILTASGYVVAQREAAVASKGTGRLVYLGVVEGDKVKKGQIIARLEDNDIQAQLAEAKANLELNNVQLNEAENNYKRQKELLQSGSTSKMNFENAETNYKKVLASIDLAKARVQAAEVALENMLIRAPFDGTVLTKNADVGEMVAPLAAGINSKAAVVTIADMSSLQVEADVSESNIVRIKPDQNCKITLDAYPDHEYDGFVAKIVPTADRSKATVMVKVGFRNYDNRVLPEMSAKVNFLAEKVNENSTDEKPALIVPRSAVASRGGKNVVYKINDGEAVEIPVTTGRNYNNYIEIKSGLENGDQIIDDLNEKIANGTKVKIK